MQHAAARTYLPRYLFQFNVIIQGHSSSNMVSDAELAEALVPFACCALGWFCLGYHTNAAPGRSAAIATLLAAANLWPPSATETTVAQVLARLLSTMPQVLTLVPRAISTYTPVLASQQPATLMHVLEFVPYSGDSRCKCGRPVVLWRQTEALCFTFARGLVRARVLFLRCFQCSAVYGPGLKVNLKHNEHKTHMYVHVDLSNTCVHAKSIASTASTLT